jgi:hypothetical protein
MILELERACNRSHSVENSLRKTGCRMNDIDTRGRPLTSVKKCTCWNSYVPQLSKSNSPSRYSRNCLLVNKQCTEFRENSTDGLVPDTGSQTDGRGHHVRSYLFCFVQNVNKQQHAIFFRRKLSELSERNVSPRCIEDSCQRPLYWSKSTNTRCFLASCLRWALWPVIVNWKV